MTSRVVKDVSNLIAHYKSSRSIRQTARAFNVSRGTVYNLVKRYAPKEMAPAHLHDRAKHWGKLKRPAYISHEAAP